MIDRDTLAQIRAQYPNPISDRDRGTDEDPHTTYCVGGALCLGFQAALRRCPIDNWRFPETSELSMALIALNPDLADPTTDVLEDLDDEDETRAWEFANAIIETNDVDRDFEGAWCLVEEALAYRREEAR